jgi:hypothetical protein
MICNKCRGELGIVVLPTGPYFANFQDLKYICTPCINDMADAMNLNPVDSPEKWEQIIAASDKRREPALTRRCATLHPGDRSEASRRPVMGP